MVCKYMDTRSAAEYLGLAQQTLCNYRCQGKGPKWTPLPNGRVRYVVDDLERWVHSADVPAYPVESQDEWVLTA